MTLPKTGFVLSEAGEQRLLVYGVAQAKAQNADMANPLTWQTAFDRLLALGCFDESKAEIGYDESLRVVEPVAPVVEPAPTMADLEALPTHTREGAAKAREIVSNAVFGDEARSVFQGFVAHVSKTFGYDLTPDDQREIILWFSRNNKSFMDHRAYDQCKMDLVRRGLLPQSCLTADEQKSMIIEDEPTHTWEGRRNLLQEITSLRKR